MPEAVDAVRGCALQAPDCDQAGPVKFARNSERVQRIYNKMNLEVSMRHLLVLSVLLLGATWAAGQNYPSQKKSANTGSQTTVEGCLSGSAGKLYADRQEG